MVSINLDKQTLQNWVSLGLWGPIFILLYGVAIAGAGAAVRYALFGEIPPLPSSASSQAVSYALLGALGFIYYLNLQYVYGEKKLQTAQENIAEIKDQLDD